MTYFYEASSSSPSVIHDAVALLLTWLLIGSYRDSCGKPLLLHHSARLIASLFPFLLSQAAANELLVLLVLELAINNASADYPSAFDVGLSYKQQLA